MVDDGLEDDAHAGGEVDFEELRGRGEGEGFLGAVSHQSLPVRLSLSAAAVALEDGAVVPDLQCAAGLDAELHPVEDVDDLAALDDELGAAFGQADGFADFAWSSTLALPVLQPGAVQVAGLERR